MTIRAAALMIVVATPCLMSCNQPDQAAGGVVHDTLTAAPLVSTESGLIGGVTAMDVGDDGRLYVTDYSLKQVLSIAPDGADPRVMGRHEGPAVILVLDADTGELLRRRAVQGVSHASRFALDSDRGTLYLASGDDASIVTVDLPEH